MRLGPSIQHHLIMSVIAVAMSVAAAVAVATTSDAIVLVSIVWMVVAILTLMKAVMIIRALLVYRRFYRLGQEHRRWSEAVKATQPHTAGVE